MPDDLRLALRIRADLNQALNRLSRFEERLRRTGTSAGAAGAKAGAAARGVDRLGRSAERAGRRISRLDVAVGAFGANIAAGIFLRASRGVTDFAADVVAAGVRIESLEQRFRFAAGGIAEGARELQFAREQAARLGIDFLAAAQGYSSLAAAARGTVLENNAREIFLGIAEAGTVLQLSAGQVAGALTAVEQIISKGKVSAEELRQQLGERLPGAVQIFARALGISLSELDKRLEQGQVGLRDLLLFTRQLRRETAADLPAATDTAAASFARLGNAIEDLKQSIAKSGAIEFVASLAKGLRELVDLARGPQTAGGRADRDIRQILRPDDIAAPDDLAAASRGLPRRAGATISARLNELLFTDSAISHETAAAIRASGAEVEGALIDAAADIGRARAEFLDFLLKAEETIPLPDRGFARISALRERTRLREAADRARARARAAAQAGAGVEDEDRTPPAQPDRRAGERARREETAALRAFARIREQSEVRLARAAEDRVARVNLAERRQLEAARRAQATLVRLAGDDQQKLYAAYAAGAQARIGIARAASAERRRIRDDEARKALEAAERQAAAEAEVVQRVQGAIRTQEERLGIGEDAYARGIAAAHRWRDEQLAALDKVGVGFAGLRAEVQATFEAMVEEASQARTGIEGLAAGARRAFRDIARDADDSFEQGRNAARRAFDGMGDALAEFVTTGKANFSDLANSIIADLARIAIRQSITGPLANALGGLFGGGGFTGPANLSLGSFGFPVGHSGGLGSELTRSRAGAGLRSGEQFTIMRREEALLTPGQLRAVAGAGGGPRELRAEIVNTGGQQQRVREATATIDPEAWVIRIVTEDIASGGQIGRQIEGIAPGATL